MSNNPNLDNSANEKKLQDARIYLFDRVQTLVKEVEEVLEEWKQLTEEEHGELEGAIESLKRF